MFFIPEREYICVKNVTIIVPFTLIKYSKSDNQLKVMYCPIYIPQMEIFTDHRSKQMILYINYVLMTFHWKV